ncbi:MAG TPA: GDP-mannose 4,6-dehydratase, partial [Sphingomonadaceae bacterium]|nr:GDP-mannose 4,6-dehydratase [Sphingomonadaceae bacterium]
MKLERVLLTGGTGYIGSHTAVVLIQAGYDVTLFDNLRNSKSGTVDGIERIAGIRPAFQQGDIRDAALVERVLRDKGIQAVIHFAGLKSVAES